MQTVDFLRPIRLMEKFERLPQTWQPRVVAEMNDGTLYTASREVKVTIGGCGG